MDEYTRANLANWNERVAGHTAPDGYESYRLLATEPGHCTDVVRFDAERLGDVNGLRLLHAQCHIGTDTLSWANLGASVTGLDFSPEAITAARSLADQMGADATFVESELYSAPANLSGQFDIVYTGVGAICWLPDIERWADTLAAFVAPGGRFYIRDTHPALLALDDERDDDAMIVAYRYFANGEPQTFENDASYRGSATISSSRTYEWPHSLASVVNALIGAGLTIERLDEHQHLDWKFFSWMESDGERFVLPAGRRDQIPLQFSILASRPS